MTPSESYKIALLQSDLDDQIAAKKQLGEICAAQKKTLIERDEEIYLLKIALLDCKEAVKFTGSEESIPRIVDLALTT